MSIVYEKRNLIPSTVCEEIISTFEKTHSKKLGCTSTGLKINLKKCTEVRMHSQDNLWKHLEKYITTKILSEVKPFMSYLSSDIFKLTSMEHFISIFGETFSETLILTGLQIQKYNPGDYFKPHIDSLPGRVFAVILYLNTLENDQGGKTSFYDGRVIKPEQGKLIIFPATWTHLHSGCEVIKGHKYIITSFLRKRISNA